MVWPVGDTAVLVSGQQSNGLSPHITVLIDRLSGTVSLLWMENLRLESAPLLFKLSPCIRTTRYCE